MDCSVNNVRGKTVENREEQQVKKYRKQFFAAWPFSQKGQPVQKVHQKCEKVCQKCEKVHWEALEFLAACPFAEKGQRVQKSKQHHHPDFQQILSEQNYQ